MGQEFSDRQTIAGVLALLVHARSVAGGSDKTSRTGLQASVPASERAAVRRGLDALLEQGVLAMSGEDIGFTTKGRLFLAHVQRARGEPPTACEHDDESPAVLAAILRAIEQDDRFAPPGPGPIEDTRTLPARLEGYLAARPPRFAKGWIVVGGLTAAAAILALLN